MKERQNIPVSPVDETLSPLERAYADLAAVLAQAHQDGDIPAISIEELQQRFTDFQRTLPEDGSVPTEDEILKEFEHQLLTVAESTPTLQCWMTFYARGWQAARDETRRLLEEMLPESLYPHAPLVT